jgi:hypothetical protein
MWGNRPSLYESINELPQPEPVMWDLDAYVQTLDSAQDGEASDIPAWIMALSEQQATRIFQESVSGKSEQKILGILREVQPPLQIFQDGVTLLRITNQLTRNESPLRAHLQNWIKRHNEGLKETPGRIIRGMQFLRIEEQRRLLKPTLQSIVATHFDRKDNAKDRTLLDLGSWDGSVTSSLHDNFSSLIAVEQNDERFNKLSVLSNRFPRMKPLQMDIRDMVKQRVRIQSDAVLMSHLLYYFADEDDDIDLLKWTTGQLRQDGITMITLNDTIDEPGTRKDLRRSFDARENTPDIRKYADWFKAKDMGVRLLRPEIRFTASSKDAVIALTDIIRYMIPGEVRQDERRIERYVRGLQDEHGLYTFRHRLSVLTAGQSIVSKPEEWECFRVNDYASETVVRTASATSHAVRATIASPEPQSWTHIETSLMQMSPGDTLALVDRILEATQWGSDGQILGKILEQCGIARAHFFTLTQNRERLEAMQREGTLTIADILTIKRPVTQKKTIHKHRRNEFFNPSPHQWDRSTLAITPLSVPDLSIEAIEELNDVPHKDLLSDLQEITRKTIDLAARILQVQSSCIIQSTSSSFPPIHHEYL